MTASASRRSPSPAPPARPTSISSSSVAGPLPLIYHVHGGGYIVGFVEQFEGMLRAVAADVGCAIVSVEYRLAPETIFPGAIEDLTNAMALRPDRVALLSRRGWLYIVSDAPKLALHDFEAAIQLDPSFADAYNGRGYARLRLGEHRDAVADADAALGKGERTSHLLYNAARVYALAAVVAAAEVRKRGQETVALVARYEDRATGLLREALKRMPEADRTSFWRDVVPSDPALRALRRRLSAVDTLGDRDGVGRGSPGPALLGPNGLPSTAGGPKSG